MIKIISGYTNAGGSTIALITLTNELNRIGVETTMYGNQEWFLDRCKSNFISNCRIDAEDILICHHINIDPPKCKKILYVNHEREWSLLNKINKYWDKVVFNHKEIQEYFNYKEDYVLIPNLKQPLVYKHKPEVENIAGIIGTVEERKQTHISIKKALEDKCNKVLIFGGLHKQYFETFVKPLLSDKVIYMGYENDTQKIFDQVGKVYQSSLSEVATLVKDECKQTGTTFIGNKNTNHVVSELSNDEILKLWLNEFN